MSVWPGDQLSAQPAERAGGRLSEPLRAAWTAAAGAQRRRQCLTGALGACRRAGRQLGEAGAASNSGGNNNNNNKGGAHDDTQPSSQSAGPKPLWRRRKRAAAAAAAAAHSLNLYHRIVYFYCRPTNKPLSFWSSCAQLAFCWLPAPSAPQALAATSTNAASAAAVAAAAKCEFARRLHCLSKHAAPRAALNWHILLILRLLLLGANIIRRSARARAFLVFTFLASWRARARSPR